MIPAQQGQVDYYLPLFYDIESLEDIDLGEISPYECTIAQRKYYFQLDWKINRLDDIKIYELKITDKTICYSDLQEERSLKNQLRIDQDYLVAQFNKEVEAHQIAQNNNQELKAILNHIQEGIIYQDCKNGKIVSANEKALELFGCANSEVLNEIKHYKHIASTSTQFNAKLFQYLWNEAKESGNNEEVILINDKAPSKQWLLIRTIKEEYLGIKPVNIIFINDISRAYNATLSLKEKNIELTKYIESNVQLEQFAHVASHDLRSPIITIKSFSKLLANKCGERLDPNENKYLNIIRENADQMIDLVNDLLEYSQINSQKIKLTTINMHELVETVLLTLKTVAEQSNIRLTILNELPEVHVDEIKMKRVFQNLLSNAIKFADPNKDSMVEISSRDTDDEYIFTISDNGIGIKEGASDIFEPYTTLNLRSEYQGTGMGLAICQNILHQHNGHINYESEYGKGTKFVFTIKKNTPNGTGQ